MSSDILNSKLIKPLNLNHITTFDHLYLQNLFLVLHLIYEEIRSLTNIFWSVNWSKHVFFIFISSTLSIDNDEENISLFSQTR